MIFQPLGREIGDLEEPDGRALKTTTKKKNYM
jgi:hypothetical protein